MSLNIQLQKLNNYNIEFNSKLAIAKEFFGYFKSKLNVGNVRINVISKELEKEFELAKSFEVERINKFIDEKSLNKYIDFISLEIGFFIKNNEGVLDINNRFDSKFSDIDVEIFPNKVDKKDLYEFTSLFDNGIISFEELDSFFDSIRTKFHVFRRAFVEVLNDNPEDDDEYNPLNIVYLYDVDKSAIYRNSIKALRYLADENEEMENLYYKVKEQEINSLVNDLAEEEKFNKFAIISARQSAMVASISSFKMSARNKEDVKKYYVGIINNIFMPMFKIYPSREEMKQEALKRLSTIK